MEQYVTILGAYVTVDVERYLATYCNGCQNDKLFYLRDGHKCKNWFPRAQKNTKKVNNMMDDNQDSDDKAIVRASITTTQGSIIELMMDKDEGFLDEDEGFLDEESRSTFYERHVNTRHAQGKRKGYSITTVPLIASKPTTWVQILCSLDPTSNPCSGSRGLDSTEYWKMWATTINYFTGTRSTSSREYRLAPLKRR